ncbi:hypothetical protein AAP_06143 [Ascosphaera apis ARSEF 7405]|uniref:Translation machinery-associated protein 20 n=1 Tax=Ascosphaera apis ARSEF 7405 TaxID=392613 RepID=A0A167V0X9_9EURO|nr:hypothetical protein AAP_06143 [Ascosphaera apis ARSEF 7405]
MFKKEVIPGPRSKVKSSVQRSLRTKFLETHPGFEPYIDEIMPKKSSLEAVKLPEKATLYTVDSQPVFFESMDNPIIPHLKVVHKYPNALPSIGIDRGAIRFVLSGAALMAPGLTSAGGRLPDPENIPEERELNAGEVVAITAEGKEEACMVGVLKVGTEDIKMKAKGVVMDQSHYLGDGLWNIKL